MSINIENTVCCLMENAWSDYLIILTRRTNLLVGCSRRITNVVRKTVKLHLISRVLPACYIFHPVTCSRQVNDTAAVDLQGSDFVFISRKLAKNLARFLTKSGLIK